MSSPVRQTFRPVPEKLSTFPVITRRETTNRQIGQITYLIWRLDMFLKDRDVPKEQRREQIQRIRKVWARGSYEPTCQAIESVMKAHVQRQLDQIQAIFNER